MSNTNRFQDIMDPSRVLEVVRRGVKNHRCRVYFKTGKHQELVYHGMALVPTSFFDEGNRLGVKALSN